MRAEPRVSSAEGQRRSAADGVYAALKHEILSNALPAGLQATESEISERLGTSRTPVREAMIHLEAEGLIEILPRKGFRVVPVRAADMAEIYEILAALEPLAARRVAARRPERDDLSALADAADDMERALQQQDLDRWAIGDDLFHREILRLGGNDRLIAIASSLFSQAHRAQMVTVRMRDLPVRSNEEHRRVLECMIAGDVEGAGTALRDHRRRGGQELLDILQAYGLPPL